MIGNILRRIVSRGIWATIQNYKILSITLGQFKTMRQCSSVDASGNPIPWYTYPAIEYIKQLDFKDKVIFEYGSGNSTLFWARRCDRLVSVEDNRKWYEKIREMLPDNVEYKFREGTKEYAKAITGYPHKFDIIIIDGSCRYECAKEALENLKSDGFLILDNSDWNDKTSELLRGAGLIEVDMSGFGPINGYTWTTSFYFTRSVAMKPAHARQPFYGEGSLRYAETQGKTI